jgi:hypothetical protein
MGTLGLRWSDWSNGSADFGGYGHGIGHGNVEN